MSEIKNLTGIVPNAFLLRIAEAFVDLGICFNEKLSNYEDAESCFSKAASIKLKKSKNAADEEKLTMMK